MQQLISLELILSLLNKNVSKEVLKLHRSLDANISSAFLRKYNLPS